MARLAQPVEEVAGFLELLGPRALGEVAADDDEVGFLLVNALLDRIDQPRVVSTEMQIGQVDQPNHGNSNALATARFTAYTAEMDRTEANSGTREVTERLRFDEAALERWLTSHVEASAARSRSASSRAASRTRPIASTPAPAATSFAANRPANFCPAPMRSIANTGCLRRSARRVSPSPKVYGLCEDESVIGTAFYVMDMVAGPRSSGKRIFPT